APAASNGILVPVPPDRTTVRALRLLRDQVSYLETAINRDPITYYGLVPGLYRRPISSYAHNALRELQECDIPVLSHLPLGVVMNEAAARGMPVTTFAPETVQAAALRQIAAAVDSPGVESGQPIVPDEQEFVYEDFISDVARARNAHDNGARRKLYDLLPKRPRQTR